MAAPSYTYVLTNGTTADASQVMQDFNDILNGVTDGTKDLSINALTCAGTVLLNGNTTLGNASADDITITGSLASSIPIKTTNVVNIGSADLGLASIYFGTADADTARIVSAALAADVTYTLPDAGASANFVMSEGAATVNGAKTFTGLFSLTTQPFFMCSDTSTRTYVNGTADATVILTAGTEDLDQLNYVSALPTFTVPAGGGGIYLAIVSAQFSYTTNPATQDSIILSIRKNGSSTVVGQCRSDLAKTLGQKFNVTTLTLVSLAAADTIAPYISSNVGNGGSTRVLTGDMNQFIVAKVG